MLALYSTAQVTPCSFSARPGRRRSLLCAFSLQHRTYAERGAREQVPDLGRLQRMVAHDELSLEHDVYHDKALPRVTDIRHIDDEQGWGFVACCDIVEGLTIVSVPLSETIIGIDEAGMAVPWNLQMVEQLLQRLSQGVSQPWMDALPVHVDLPFLYWDDDDIAWLGDPCIIGEILTLREFCKSPDVQAYMSEYDWEDVLWGFAMVHSRSFVYSEGRHLFSPLIDMANHGDSPNAAVQLTYSPDRCQGQVATDEIAPPRPPPASAESSGVFELKAIRDIKAGEQVTISYGLQPNDVLLLYFGFALPSNEHDTVTVTLEDLRAVKGFAETGKVDNDRFFITRQGVDPRLLERVTSPTALLDLCQWKLDQLLDVERKENEAGGTLCHKDSRRHTAECFRKSKLTLLESAVKSLSA